MLGYIHDKIVQENKTDICGMWTMKSVNVQAYSPAKETGFFSVTLNLRQSGYENAIFKVKRYKRYK